MSETTTFFAEALARARACRTAGDLAGAWRELRLGLNAPVEYTTAVSAARFLENTAKESPPPGLPVRRVALVGADTLSFLRPVVRALAFRDGWWPVFYEAPFGTWRQEILDSQSALRKFQPEITLVLRGWRAVADVELNSAQLLSDELALARSAAEGLGQVLWPAYDLPLANDKLRTALIAVNEKLQASLPPTMLWVDLAEAQAALGERWEDERLWEAARQHPSPDGCVAVVENWLALLRARWGQARKVLVTDLDNVLWGGVVGEDGVEGIEIGAAQNVYHDYLLELKSKGVLLAVCSKNNEADVLEVFARRSLPLKREDFSGWFVNWTDKAENLKALATKLKLGLDSFVFVDDQPAERARVRQALPEVAVPELPLNPIGYVSCLRERRLFDTLTVSEEDRKRATFYQADEQREQVRAGAATVEDFLRSLEMVAEHGSFDEATLDRVEQLLSRTNQWNLTTRRHSRAEIVELMAQTGALTCWFRLRDKFGDHGLVGLWIVLPCDSGAWEIDSWVMSCRVIGRGFEDLMFNTMVETARAAGARKLRGVYRPTAKNSLVKDLLPNLGFEPLSDQTTDTEKTYILDLTKIKPKAHFIQALADSSD